MGVNRGMFTAVRVRPSFRIKAVPARFSYSFVELST